jgi:Carboxypeptidase regulatory-like domain/TonB-dependent Receptor Plug Domain
VSGVVRDSVAHLPLAGASVQLADVDDPTQVATAVSDSLGRFAFAGVADGRYTLGFFHALLDSLGVEAGQRELRVEAHRAVRADLATPSPAQLRAAVCHVRAAADSGALLLGVVRDARDGAPLGGATVVGDWLELSFTAIGVVRRVPRLAATTGDNGWFALCGLPRGGTMQLLASRGADSTDRIDVTVSAEGFERRDLYLGRASTVATTESAPRADSLAPRPRRVRTGDGRVAGTVVAAAGGRPLPGAQVSIVDGPRAVADAAGNWTLADAPVGTRVLEVRAIGYYPERRRVDVVRGAPPVRVALSTLKSVLDTVRVTASRLGQSGFEERRRGGTGRYLTASEIERRNALTARDLFRTIGGVRLGYDTLGREAKLVMRGPFGICSPAVFVDGMYFADIDTDDLNTIVRPSEIVGIEVYTEATAPPQFQRMIGGVDSVDPCGSILIWTR